MAKPFVIGLKEDATLIMSVGRFLGVEPALAKEGRYPAGEIAFTVPPKVPAHCLVVGSVREDPSSLTRLLFLAQALRAAGNRKVTLVAPWIAYGRQDRAVEPGGCPAGIALAKALAKAFDRIVTLDAHSPTFVKAFGTTIRNVTPDTSWFSSEKFDSVAAPDIGARVRASSVAKELHLPFVQMEKQRHGLRVVSRVTSKLPKNFIGSRVLLFDDMADSGQTLVAAARALKEAGASSVGACVSHTFDLEKLRDRIGSDVSFADAFFDHASNRWSNHVLPALIASAV